jgi:hypothetical protein
VLLLEHFQGKVSHTLHFVRALNKVDNLLSLGIENWDLGHVFEHQVGISVLVEIRYGFEGMVVGVVWSVYNVNFFSVMVFIKEAYVLRVIKACHKFVDIVFIDSPYKLTLKAVLLSGIIILL